ncbi:R3 [Macaca mulatta rhadinovirus 17577]|uniref:R3 n=2 Tax=Macacine gammaherpesvirus 5 TaxID=154334 RepID=Q9WRT7_9GAMA|nr:R3 [Macacine gammaherpesvirus 5]AAD21341.1 R3 [Macaca mulatta rhadinovirus 17577]WUF06308.1 R3 [synthetic construct]WVG99615.1 R3 [Macaca mulatta rhadinovirus]AAD53010.1 R3 protein [Macacine gammaherpesvirus 5]WSP06985.1 R3 [Macacine gammaherpesvirus 5]
MRGLFVCVFFAVFACVVDYAFPMGSMSGPAPELCCLGYVTHLPPPGLVVSYSHTSSQCSVDAVILNTRRGKKLCANPGDDAVKKLLQAVDKRPKKGRRTRRSLIDDSEEGLGSGI